MNEQDRQDLDRLSLRQQELQRQLDQLRLDLSQWAARAKPAEPAAGLAEIRPLQIAPLELGPLAEPLAPAAPKAPPPVPPIIPAPPQPAAAAAIPAAPPGAPATDPSVAIAPSAVERLLHHQPEVAPAAAPALSREPVGATVEPAIPLPPSPPLEAAGPPPSLELRLGTYWLVRVGMVMLLTGLVWAGYYAYDNFQLGPGGRLLLLYLASGALLGAGAWLQRQKEAEPVRHFGQVVFAGGLAAVYFTTYAAYYVENLRVIRHALVDGGLLLGWAAFMVWLADRRKTEVLALFGIGLAYYTSVITNIGLFTLYSNLVLTAASTVFLVRNRWATLSGASLVATYVGFIFWRFYHHGWFWNLQQADLNHGNLFLAGYWLVFTVAGFMAQGESLALGARTTFLSLNNAAFFILVLLSMWHVQRGSFWRFSLGYGVVLLGLAALAARVRSEDKALSRAYLVQGLALFTLGLVIKFSGVQLALLLATQSAVLLVLADLLNNPILSAGSAVSAVLALGWGVHDLRRDHWPELGAGVAVGALLVFNAVWTRRRPARRAAEGFDGLAVYYAALGLLMWLVATWRNAAPHWLVPILALEALVFTGSYYLLRVREIPLLGQGFLLLAQVLWLADHPADRPWWNPAVLIAVTLLLSHWWQRQKALPAEPEVGQVCQGLYALALMGCLYFWLEPGFTAPVWLAFTSLLAVGLTVYGLVTGAWFLAAMGQVFFWISAWEFLEQLHEGHPPWTFALVPMATALGTALLAVAWFERHPKASRAAREPVLMVAALYRWLALLMALSWIYEYVPAHEQVWVLGLLGAAAFFLAAGRRGREALGFSAVFFTFSMATFVWLPERQVPTVYAPNLLAILALGGLPQWARRWPQRVDLTSAGHASAIVVAGLMLWLFVSRWVVLKSGGAHFYLTASWAALALGLFGAGLGLRERLYRWLGLGLLGCALGRVVLSDVWRLATLYRILSFIALGLVLLVLGFIYNKYQDKIKDWL